MKKEYKNNGFFFGVIIVVAVFFLVAIISNAISNANRDKAVKQEVQDVNYCRSVAAKYGQQGTQGFSQAYNSCMDGKGW